jgi:hypothetical protein
MQLVGGLRWPFFLLILEATQNSKFGATAPHIDQFGFLQPVNAELRK